MKAMSRTLDRLKKDKEALDETIAVLEQLSRQLEKARRPVRPDAEPLGVPDGSGQAGKR